MTYENMLQPKYKSESEKYVHLYNDATVSKEFYDLLWPNFVSFMSGMYFGHVYTIHEFLGNSDLLDLLGEDGIKAAEKCLLHIAHADLLPIVIDGKCDGDTCFKSKY